MIVSILTLAACLTGSQSFSHPTSVGVGFVSSSRFNSSRRSSVLLLSTPDALALEEEVVEDIVPMSMSNAPRSFWEMNAKSLFDTFDVDNSGDIDVEELKQLASELFPFSVWDKEDVFRLAQDIDINKDGLISFDEFKSWLSFQVGRCVDGRQYMITINMLFVCVCHDG